MALPQLDQEQERSIFKAFKAGDESAFEIIFKTHYSLLLKLALFYLENKEEAEELVQDIFYQLWQERQKIEIQKTLKGYLLLSVKNRCLNKLRKPTALVPIEEDDEFSSWHEADSELNLKEAQKTISDALARLPEQCRIIFLMHRQEGLSYKEIAELLNIAPKTVENQIGKALKLLRADLKDLYPLVFIFLYLEINIL